MASLSVVNAWSHPHTGPGDGDCQPGRRGQAGGVWTPSYVSLLVSPDGVDGQLVLVYVVVTLEDKVEVPDLVQYTGLEIYR